MNIKNLVDSMKEKFNLEDFLKRMIRDNISYYYLIDVNLLNEFEMYKKKDDLDMYSERDDKIYERFVILSDEVYKILIESVKEDYNKNLLDLDLKEILVLYDEVINEIIESVIY